MRGHNATGLTASVVAPFLFKIFALALSPATWLNMDAFPQRGGVQSSSTFRPAFPSSDAGRFFNLAALVGERASGSITIRSGYRKAQEGHAPAIFL